jgi:2-polyprenyl-6-hydroxyphenyl methylase/3-demethylubiquinone-9 3-methyltransferase
MGVTMTTGVIGAGVLESVEAHFEFGRNWASFLRVLSEERMALARQSLVDMLGCSDLTGKTFLDIGTGSGLFSLAAMQLGAEVFSFDYDADAVNCARELKRRFFPASPRWRIEQGSVLNREFIESLGQFDVVYSWGVLHHTGAMRQALENAAVPTKNGGQLFIAIYNDQGTWSRIWTWEKKTYNQVPRVLRPLVALPLACSRELKIIAGFLRRLHPLGYVHYWTNYANVSARGMSRWHDIVDWVGGYPFEVAKPEEIFDLFRDKHFELTRLKTVGGHSGCNQFVFRRHPAPKPAGRRTSRKA